MKLLLLLFSVGIFIKKVIGDDCSCSSKTIPGCCSDECGDYCFEGTCDPYNQICSELNFPENNCTCIFTNCPDGTERCSGYISCENSVQVCNNVSVMVNNTFCFYKDDDFIDAYSANFDIKICNYTNSSSTIPNNNNDDKNQTLLPKPSKQPSDRPSKEPSSTPSVEPTFAPSITPTVIPSESPSFIPSTVPSFDPSLMPSVTPSIIPTFFPTLTSSPTAVGRRFIDRCEIYYSNGVSQTTTESIYTGAFTVPQYLNNVTANQFSTMNNSQTSFIQTVQCVMSGNYSISTVHINITNISTAQSSAFIQRELISEEIMAEESLTSATFSSTLLLYTVEFSFPASSSSSSSINTALNTYYDGLTTQLTNSVVDGNFTIIFQEYLSNANVINMMNATTATIPPVCSEPYLLSSSSPSSAPTVITPIITSTTQPSTTGPGSEISGSSSSSISLSNQQAIILGSVMITLCALCTLLGFYCVYTQHQQQKEREMLKWSAHKKQQIAASSQQSSSVYSSSHLSSSHSSSINSSGSSSNNSHHHRPFPFLQEDEDEQALLSSQQQSSRGRHTITGNGDGRR